MAINIIFSYFSYLYYRNKLLITCSIKTPSSDWLKEVTCQKVSYWMNISLFSLKLKMTMSWYLIKCDGANFFTQSLSKNNLMLEYFNSSYFLHQIFSDAGALLAQLIFCILLICDAGALWLILCFASHFLWCWSTFTHLIFYITKF